MSYKLLSVSTYDFKNDEGEQVQGGKVIVYDDNSPKNEPLQIINLNVDISVAQNVLNQVLKYPANVDLVGTLNSKGKFVVNSITIL